MAGWSLLVRAFTPLGAALALLGLWKWRRLDGGVPRFWWAWGGATFLAMALVAGKLHHEYYWLPLAPVAAVGSGPRDRAADPGRPRGGRRSADSGAVALGGFQARSTWETPPEWAGVEAAGRTVALVVPPRAWVAASEALLFQADRRGCRMEWTAAAARRAAGEWGGRSHVETPIDLIGHYRSRGARYFADLGAGTAGSPRKGLHDAVRRRYKVIVDSPEVFIADLSDSGTYWNAN